MRKTSEMRTEGRRGRRRRPPGWRFYPSVAVQTSLRDDVRADLRVGKTRVVRIVVIHGDRHMIVDVPSLIARILFQSLEKNGKTFLFLSF
jgi:hypothetical protein